MVYGMLQSGLIFYQTVRSALFLLIIPVILSGCLTVRPPAEIKYTDGAAVTSLSSKISLSYSAPGRSISGSGYLMYRKPDQLRVVILSPFGSVLQEIFIAGESVTIIDTGNGTAFSGTFTDLPDKGDFSGWRHIHWLIDIDPPDSLRDNGVIERDNRFGQQEKAAFENGLLISKTTPAGGQVRYGRYAAVQGVPFPLEIKYENTAKEKFTILLEESEINVPFPGDAFTPNLGKLHVYPLSILK
jgi:outer membrane lipoprotein-sorting protein